MEVLYEYLGQVRRKTLLRELEKLLDYAKEAKWPRQWVTMLKKDVKHFARVDESRR
jgi:hypothetical protein